MNRPFIKAAYCGILLSVFSVFIMAVNPSKAVKLPDGFFTPVIAFEFLKTEAEVYDLFGREASTVRDKILTDMRMSTKSDFIYIIIYTSFLLLFINTCRRITKSKWFISGAFIALLVLLSDFAENMQMLAIMNNLASGDFSAELYRLNIFTWAKWGGLTAVFISLIPFLRNSGVFGRIVSVIILLSGISGSAAFLQRSVINEIYVLSIALIFLLLIIFSFTYKTVKKQE